MNNPFLKINDNRTISSNFNKPETSNGKYRFKNKNNLEKAFFIDDNDFPDLLNNKINSPNENSSNYKDIVSSDNIKNDLSQDIIVKPGIVDISYKNNKMVFLNGPLTSYQKSVLKQNEINEYLLNDSNYNMNKAIDFMRNNWENYRNEYDSVYGEGSFEEKFFYKDRDKLDLDILSDEESDIDDDDFDENQYKNFDINV
uniref:Uncharacterized protein n=1 Tax=viral metagenome TaxID=1070528 RepID=A0A6C0KNU1_9ZZZZ